MLEIFREVVRLKGRVVRSGLAREGDSRLHPGWYELDYMWRE